MLLDVAVAYFERNTSMESEKTPKRMPLTRLPENKKAKVVEIAGGANMRDKLMSMGMNEGRELVKLSYIGLRGPVVVKTGRSVVAIGYGVAAKITVEEI
jgi:Fe2+ transport system protein FeoA